MITKDIKSNYEKFNCYCINPADPDQLKFVISRSNLIFAFGGLQYLLPNGIENFFKNC